MLLAAILSNALVVANKDTSTGYENTVQQPVHTVELIRTESDPQAEKVDMLAHLVSAEAKSEPYEGQVAVAAVVLNRVEEGFGDDIEEVIYAEGQFQPVSNGAIDKKPVDSAYDAAREALNGKDPTNGAVYFANMDIAEHHPNPHAAKTVKIGDHTFFK
jgi:N-acetylmuramoyl-L-alanine amidase